MGTVFFGLLPEGVIQICEEDGVEVVRGTSGATGAMSVERPRTQDAKT